MATRYLLAFFGLQCGLIVGVAIVIATRQSLLQMWGAIALAIALSLLFMMLIGRSRESWGYTVESDGETWIRRWNGKSDVLIRAHEIDRIERSASDLTVHSRSGTSFTITPDASGYAQLRDLIEKWDRDRSERAQ